MTDEREDWSARLEVLALDERFFTRSDDLKSLAEVVKDNHPGEWTGIDLIQAFPPDASITLAHQPRTERWLGILTGISVFLPVGWTWWGLHSATNAYDKLLTTGDEEGRTFLALWTTGFDGRLDGLHRLVPMAMMSFLLVLFAVICIVLHRFVADRNIAQEENAVREARRELVTVLSKTQRLLNQRRVDEPHFLEAAIKESIEHLNKAHKAAQEGIESLNGAVATSVEALGAAAANAVGDLNAVSTKMVSDLSPLLEAVSTASQSVASSAEVSATSQREFANASAGIHEALHQSIGDFETAIAAHNNALTQKTSESMNQLTGGVREVAQAKLEWAATLGTSMGKIDESISRFGQSLQNHESTLQGQANDLKQAADLAKQMLSELRRRAGGSGL